MVVSTLRPLLLLVAGAAIGAFITFGLLRRPASIHENFVESQTPPRTLKIAQAPKQEGDDNEPEATGVTQETPDSEGTTDYRALAALKVAQQQRVPVRPLPKPTAAFQANGLPVGVTPDAGKSDVYARLPGIQPPLINRDGRDLGPEATQMLEAPREEVPFPGGIPSASASPVPFPQTTEEANRQAQANASP
jgi:hypothetical protein